jgi:glucokinase
MRGVIGPGTGLGNSLLYPAVIKNERKTFVLPSEGGHTDFPVIDSETTDFFAYLLKEMTVNQKKINYIST